MMWTSAMGPGVLALVAAGTIGFWILIAVLVRALFNDGAEPTVVASPLHVLADRLARGEITLEEYEQRRRVLTGVSAHPDRPSASPAAGRARPEELALDNARGLTPDMPR